MTFLSRYTPSQTDPKTLEALTVGEARLRLLDDLTERARRSATTASRTHTLIVGPRGAGKTHLVTLAHSRIVELTRTKGLSVSRAWLHEEVWMTLVGYNDLLAEVLAAIDAVDAPIPDDAIAATIDARQALLEQHAAEHGPIVVLIENFDQALHALGREGQQQLRQFLENTRSLLFVATTTALTRDLTQQDSPFYNFFTTVRLEPFEVSDAREMLERLAHVTSAGDLSNLDDDVVDGRLNAVAHLAGGQPRMWSMFGQTLTTHELDDLVPAFLELIDNLTPFYQQQLERLAPQQRRIVAALARADHPMNVKELATATSLAERATAAALSTLRDSGWVQYTESAFAEALDKRLKFHELCEPLVRSMFQTKRARGDAPLPTVVDFIKHWFAPEELSVGAPTAPLVLRYLDAALDGLRTDGIAATALQLSGRIEQTDAQRIELLGRIDDAIAAFHNGDPEPILTLPTSVRCALEGHVAVLDHIRLRLHNWARREYGSSSPSEIDRWHERSSQLAVVMNRSGRAMRNVALWQATAGQFDEAEVTLSNIEEADDATTAAAWVDLAAIHLGAARWDDAKRAAQTALDRADPQQAEIVFRARVMLLLLELHAGPHDEAREALDELLAFASSTLPPDAPALLAFRELDAFWTLGGGHREEARDLYTALLADQRRVLGPQHRATLMSRSQLAKLAVASDRGEALQLWRELLPEQQRFLGPDHPDTLATRRQIAKWSTITGDLGESTDRYSELLESEDNYFLAKAAAARKDVEAAKGSE